MTTIDTPASESAAFADLGTYETLQVEMAAPHVLVVRFDRPEVRNAISTQMGHDIHTLFTRLNAGPGEIRAVVLTGTGDRAFCAGVDLKERRGMSDADWHRQHALFERMMLAMLDCPLPMIAAVNGAAFAGGCEFALLADFIYASTNARFALTEVTIGIMPGGGGTQTLQRRIGYARAAETIFTGRPISAADAADWGLVNRLTEPETLLATAVDTASAIARNAPLSIRQAKRAMTLGGRMDLRTGMFFEIDAYNALVGTADRREGITAFNEKRAPVFTGH
ncbi:enoyl-CoA hydratase/isomerase family protein [Acuticoccus sediminis]|uniref:enoyl-CoA hydratase/isomerase family protein n=1 Tax=Acuticoccus sediminis TaxID=2184697 RepID=UPI001CFCD45E|nr:enoyl-CoA hydratase-related protein [Acuticoccus sediminis]